MDAEVNIVQGIMVLVIMFRESFHLHLLMKDCFVAIGPRIAHMCTVKVLVDFLKAPSTSHIEIVIHLL